MLMLPMMQNYPYNNRPASLSQKSLSTCWRLCLKWCLRPWRSDWQGRSQSDCEAIGFWAILTAEWGSVLALSRRRACKHWKTAPPADWLFVPSRLTPKATESCRVTSCEVMKGNGGTWRNVLSACRRGEPARPWAGKDTLKNCKETDINI